MLYEVITDQSGQRGDVQEGDGVPRLRRPEHEHHPLCRRVGHLPVPGDGQHRHQAGDGLEQGGLAAATGRNNFV